MSVAFSNQIRERLERLLQEEETDLYVLVTHYGNDGEMTYFDKESRRKIKHIFEVLIHDTQKHSQILQQILGPDD